MAELRETIKSLTRHHLLENNGLLFGQCLSAVGWVGGTIPELTSEQGVCELPTSDSSNGGIVVGAALAGRKPIYVIRYQGFAWYNAVSIINYAAKSKELWQIPCSMFVRALGMEGNIGPVAGGQNHSIIMHMPGLRVVAPMTSNEWETQWKKFLSHDDVFYCSEHRSSFIVDYEMSDLTEEGPDLTIVAIGGSRLNAIKSVFKLRENHRVNLFHLVELKPLTLSLNLLNSASDSKYGCLVLDSDHTICGAAEHVACELMRYSRRPAYTLGLEDRTAGFSSASDNISPTVERIFAHATNYILRP